MIVVRAWPEHPPAGRPHVVDGWPRVAVDNYDYRGLADVGDDVISMDWDTAASLEQITDLGHHASKHPGEVLVAPCLNYRGNEPNPPTYNVGYLDGAERFQPWRLGIDEEDWADHFGFGMVYLPRELIVKYIVDNPGQPMSDVWFADWHHRVLGRKARIDWSVLPVHLHYAAAERGSL